MSSPLHRRVGPIGYRGGLPLANALLLGSGKTAAFLVPVLSKLMGKAKKASIFMRLFATFMLFHESHQRKNIYLGAEMLTPRIACGSPPILYW